MTIAQARVSVDTSEVRHLMERMLVRESNYFTVAEAAKGYLEAANAENFASNGLPVGGWAPLRPETAAWKLAHGYPATPLVDSGELFESVTHFAGANSQIRPKSAEFGTTVSYAQFHQYGAPGAHLPKRQIIFTPPGLAQMLASATADHIVGHGGAVLSGLKALFK